MATTEDNSPWRYHRFHLLVTGDTEKQHLPKLFRALMSNGHCTFQVAEKVSQLAPMTSAKRLGARGRFQRHPSLTKDEVLGVRAQHYLRQDINSFVILIDDLEYDRRPRAAEVYSRYRSAFDAVLPPELRLRASIHFLVNMLEAYYFADPQRTNEVLDINLVEPIDDVEEIRNPKADLKQMSSGFHEIQTGGEILDRLSLERVLSNPEHCRSLRTLVKWCVLKMHEVTDHRFQLLSGKLSPITAAQLPEVI